jgi:hypothetical protein
MSIQWWIQDIAVSNVENLFPNDLSVLIKVKVGRPGAHITADKVTRWWSAWVSEIGLKPDLWINVKDEGWLFYKATGAALIEYELINSLNDAANCKLEGYRTENADR